MTMKNTSVAALPCSNHHQPQEPDAAILASKKDNHEEHEKLDWYGAPLLQENSESLALRLSCRRQEFTGTTNSLCKTYLQCNLVVLPQAYAYDFLTFCQRNPKACPLVEVLEPGSPHPHALARNADLRSDLPKYCVYRYGKLQEEVLDITEYWRDDLVSFLIGCSFTFDGALEKATGMKPHAQVPMYKTHLKCRSAGVFSGNIVVSMRPVHCTNVALHTRITSQFPHAHGGPVCVGSPESIGIMDLSSPDWGPATRIPENYVPVFHACGVTPQNVVLQNDTIPLCLTHSPGHMFVTDVPAERNLML